MFGENAMIDDIIEAFDDIGGIEISSDEAEKFDRLYELLIDWNSRMNLTSITDRKDVIIKHFVDSIAIMNYCDLDDGFSVIDVGTGAGFPGLPLKILLPDLKLTMLDSVNKKLNFVREAVSELSMTGVEVIHGRAEDIAHEKKHRGKYDFCVSRAVARLNVLSELCIPFVKLDGSFISYKGSDVDEEINNSIKAVDQLGGSIEDIINYPLAGTDMERTIVIIQKIKKTPDKYPRKAGTPAKSPL